MADFASEVIKEKLNSYSEENDITPIKHNFVKRAREKSSDSQESNGKSSQSQEDGTGGKAADKPKKTNPFEIDYDESLN